MITQAGPIDWAGFFVTMSYRFPHIIIIGAGRSGTTSLQSLLNGDPSVIIRGENNNFFYETWRAYRSLKKINNGKSKSNPWYGFEHFDAGTYLENIQTLSRSFLTGDYQDQAIKVLGFKEICLFNLFNSQGPSSLKQSLLLANRSPEEELKDFVHYMEQLFPGLKVVFLRRNPTQISRSGWWKDRSRYNPEILVADLKRFHKACKKLSKSIEGVCINHRILRSKNPTTLHELLYKPLDLPFNKHRSLKTLEEELTHSKWHHLCIPNQEIKKNPASRSEAGT